MSQAKGMTTAATVSSTMGVIRTYSRRDVVKVFSIGRSSSLGRLPKGTGLAFSCWDGPRWTRTTASAVTLAER